MKFLKKIAAWFLSIYQWIAAFIKMVIQHIHGIVDTALQTVKKSISAPEIALAVALAVVCIVDLVLVGKIGIIAYALATTKTLLELITTHLWASLILAGSIILILLILKEMKALKKS